MHLIHGALPQCCDVSGFQPVYVTQIRPVRALPVPFEDYEHLVEQMAPLHAEFLFIHPFREGNGFTRLCVDLIAVKSGFDRFNFKKMDEKKMPDYITAVQSAAYKNYAAQDSRDYGAGCSSSRLIYLSPCNIEPLILPNAGQHYYGSDRTHFQEKCYNFDYFETMKSATPSLCRVFEA